MMKWTVKFLPEALKDLDELDKSIRVRVLKAVLKLEKDPLSYGEPLGSKLGLDLTGLFKLKVAKGYRVVYYAQEQQVYVAVIAIGKRSRFEAYKGAAQRIAEYREETNQELSKISALLNST